METEPQQQGIIDQLFHILEQLVLPNWSNLIQLLPWVLFAVIVGWLLFIAVQWRRAGAVNRPRVPRPLPGGDPPVGVHMPGPSRWPFVLPVGAVLLIYSIFLPPRDAAGNTTGAVSMLPFVVGLVITIIAMVGWLRDASHEWRATAEPELGDGHGARHALPAAASVASAGAVSASVAMVPAHAAALQRAGVSAIEAEDRSYAEPPPGVHMPGPSPWPFFAPIAMAVMLYGVIFSAVLVVGGLILALIAMAGWYLEAGHEYRTTEAVGHAVPATRDPQRAWPRRLVPVYLAVIGISFAVALAPLFLGFLNGLTPPEATPPPISVPAVPKIAANSATSFDTKLLIVPAGRPFDLEFSNNDPGVPHNVQIDDSPERTATLFDGEVVNGPTTVTYHVPALEVGDYYFLCKIHPNMNGTLSAMLETGGPGAPPASGDGGGGSPAPQASAAP